RKSAKQIHHRLIRFPVLCREARHDVAEIAFVELRIFADLSGKEAFAKRTEWNEPDPEFRQRRQHFLFRFSPPQRVFALQCGDGLDFVCATNRLDPCFRKSEVLHLSLLNQLLHGSGDFFDRHVGVNAVLIVQIDDISLQALQRALGGFLDVFWPTVQPGLFSGTRINLEPELGGDHHLVAKWSEGFTHELFVCERAIYFCRVEKRDAAFDGRPNQRDHLLLVSWRTVAKAHAHAAEPESRYFQVAFSKFALLHRFSLRCGRRRSKSLRAGSKAPIPKMPGATITSVVC